MIYEEEIFSKTQKGMSSQARRTSLIFYAALAPLLHGFRRAYFPAWFKPKLLVFRYKEYPGIGPDLAWTLLTIQNKPTHQTAPKAT